MTGFLYQNKLCGESVRQQRGKKRDSVRDSVLLEIRYGVSNKIDHCRKYLWQMWEINLKRSRWPLIMVFP